MKLATILGSVLAVVCLAFPVKADENLVKFIEHYNGVEVRIEHNSAECDVANKDLYAKRVGDGLAAIGITHNPQALTRAYLFIWAEPFGPLDQQCATFMSLRLGADVSSVVGQIGVTIASDRIFIDKLRVIEGTFPAAFYLTSKLFVKVRLNMPDHVLKTINDLVKEVDKGRKS